MAQKPNQVQKVKILALVIVVLFACLGVRLFYLQVINEDTYATLSENNRFRILSIPARRGNIYDTNMQELAISKPVFSISVVTDQIRDKDALAIKLSQLLSDPAITANTILDKINSNDRDYEPVVIKRILYDEGGISLVSKLEEMKDQLPGVLISEEPMRYYPNGTLAGHLLGTVGLISKNEKNLIADYGYLTNEWIGKSGLEKTQERVTANNQDAGLRGQNGMEQVEIDAKSTAVRTVSTQAPVSGNSLVLTIDAGVQKVMEDSMAETISKLQERYPKCKAGSAVLLNVKTGGVIAMASYPTMDPNDFSNGLSSDKAAYYWSEDLKPTLNRAVSATYPPGSTFKMVTATAALSAGVIDGNTTVTCSPSMWVAPRARCPKAHGAVNLKKALAVSCNTYFQEIGYRVGNDALYETGLKFGFGQKTNIDLTGEVAGLLPSEAWKNENFSGWEQTWRNYDTFYMSMGQGYNSFTTLQLANYVATIANGGHRMQPYLVDQVVSSEDGSLIYQYQSKVVQETGFSDSVLAQVREAMHAVAQPGGTAYSIFAALPVELGCKTGTAQTGLVGDDKDKDYHGIFVAFAPYDDPQVAFACVIEYGYHGGSSGGVICKSVLEQYFGLNPEPIPDQLPEAQE